MSEKTVAEKARVRPGVKFAAVNAVDAVVASLGLPADAQAVDVSAADLVFLFVRDRDELEREMRRAIAALPSGSALWVFFRKGGAAQGRDMSRDDVWAVAEKADMRPLGLVSVDDEWSAFRLRAHG